MMHDRHNYTYMPGLKTGMDFTGQDWKRVWKMTSFGLKYSQDLENQAAHPHQEFTGVHLPGYRSEANAGSTNFAKLALKVDLSLT